MSLSFTNPTAPPPPLAWLWYPCLPLGRVCLVVGPPGIGKSWLATHLAAGVTIGALTADAAGHKPQPAAVLPLVPHQETAIVQRRFHGMRGNLTLLHLPQTAASSTPWRLPQDANALAQAVASVSGPPTKLVIIDPLTAFTQGPRPHSPAAIRNALAALDTVAERCGATVIAVVPTTEPQPPRRLPAWMADAAVCWFIQQDPQVTQRRLFRPVKHNLGPPPAAWAFSIQGSGQHAALQWEQAPLPPDPPPSRKLAATSRNEKAQQFLYEYLSSGSAPTRKILEHGALMGFSEHQLTKARDAIGAYATKRGYQGPWYWAFPEMDDMAERAEANNRAP